MLQEARASARLGSVCPALKATVKAMEQGKILVVDDDARLRFILKTQLCASGYEVREAGDGHAGLVAAREWLPDVIVMDVNMPKMDGRAATRLLKQSPLTKHIPVLMLTGNSASDDLVAGLDAGAEDYIRKPFGTGELLARIRSAHRLARVRGELNRLNDRLAEEVECKTARLRLLYEFTRALNGTSTRDGVLDLIIATTQKATDAQRISLMLRDENGEFLRCERAVGIDSTLVPRILVNRVEGIIGQVFTSGKTYSARAYGRRIDNDRRYDGHEFLSTPLVSTSLETGGEILGVLNVTEKQADEAFSDEEIDCIRAIADSGAIALHNQIRRERLRDSVKVLIMTVGRLAEYRDEETSGHLHRVAEYARILSTELSGRPDYQDVVTPDFIEDLVQAAPMHDIGKVAVPDGILLKPGPLTDEEFAVMKSHTLIGRQTLELGRQGTESIPMLQMCIDIAYCHHEKHDGRGYPRGISGDEIPLPARIIALVDAYDAITSVRPYKDARSHEQAIKAIQESDGTHFNPHMVMAFMDCHEQFDAIRERFGNADAADKPFALSPCLSTD